MLSQFFIGRPIFAWVIAIMMMMAGIISIFTLSVSQYPTIALPEISIDVSYPGASAKTIEDTVTQVIEQKIDLAPLMPCALAREIQGIQSSLTVLVLAEHPVHEPLLVLERPELRAVFRDDPESGRRIADADVMAVRAIGARPFGRFIGGKSVVEIHGVGRALSLPGNSNTRASSISIFRSCRRCSDRCFERCSRSCII